jgi:hypothetical protein
LFISTSLVALSMQKPSAYYYNQMDGSQRDSKLCRQYTKDLDNPLDLTPKKFLMHQATILFASYTSFQKQIYTIESYECPLRSRLGRSLILEITLHSGPPNGTTRNYRETTLPVINGLDSETQQLDDLVV